MILVILIILLLVVLFSFLTYKRVFYSPDKYQNDVYNIPKEEQYLVHKDLMSNLINEMLNKPYKDVYIKSYDGLMLHARYYENKKNAPVDIAFHGYRGNLIRDFCGGANISFDINHNLLLVSQRAHGNSKGHTITFGVKEKNDVLSWINYVIDNNKKDIKIVLYGVSMGASTILMASGLNLPSNVKCIIADSPFISPKKIILKVCKDIHYLPLFVYPFIYLGALLFAHINLESRKTNALYYLDKTNIPILIIHGEDDHFVPCNMSVINKKNVKRVVFNKSGHGLSYIVHKKEYEKLVKQFIKKNI